jgi:hypothetical protein
MVSLRTKGIDFKLFKGFFIITFIMSLLNINKSFILSLNFIIGSFGNICGVIVASFLFNCFSEKIEFKDRIMISLASGAGLIIYEFLQKWIPWQTFDKNDIYGSLLGITIAILLNILVIRLNSSRKNENLLS